MACFASACWAFTAFWRLVRVSSRLAKLRSRWANWLPVSAMRFSKAAVLLGSQTMRLTAVFVIAVLSAELARLWRRRHPLGK